MYREISDEELILWYRAGHEDAIDYIMERYKNLVRKKAKAMYLAGGDNDDLIQEGMIGLYKAVRDYDGTHAASFATFASMCVNRQMCTAVTNSNRKKYSPLNGYVSLDMPVGAGNEHDSESETKLLDILKPVSDANPEKLFLEQEHMAQINDQMVELLSAFEQQVIGMYMNGQNYVEIARILGKEPKSVDNAIQRIRRKLKSIQ